MSSDKNVDALRALVRHRREFLARGYSDRWLGLACDRGELIRLQRGWYVFRADWEALRRDRQHLLRLIAADRSSPGSPVFSHGSAAVILRLPVLQDAIERVHTTRGKGQKAHTIRGHLKHCGTLEARDLAETFGFRHTNEARTVLDVARFASFECGLICAEAALFKVASENEASVEATREAWLTRLAELPRSGGYQRAVRVLQFASFRSESPLESLGRLQFERLGFEVTQQIPVEGPHGERYRIDIRLDGFGIYVELDGKQKYTEELLRAGKSMEQVILEEKAREDWIRGSQNVRVLRGEWKDVFTLEAASRFLRSYGVTPPGLPGGLPRDDLFA